MLRPHTALTGALKEHFAGKPLIAGARVCLCSLSSLAGVLREQKTKRVTGPSALHTDLGL